MVNQQRDPQSVTLSVRLFRALILSYPAEFRQEYGESMVQAFRDSARRVISQGGGLALFALWGWTAVDFLKTMVEEHINGGIHMTREKFIKLSGWALIVGSISIFIGFLASSRPDYDQFNALSQPVDRYANAVGWPVLVLGLLLTSLGMLGMLARYGPQAGNLGRFFLGFGAFSSLVSALGVIGMVISDSGPGWSMFTLGLTIQFLSLALFGLVNLKLKLLSRWNSLPLIAGIWAPVLVVLNLGVGWQPSDGVIAVILLIGFGGLLALGYVLQADSQSPTLAIGTV